MTKKALPPKEKCKHESVPMFVKHDGRIYPNLNHKKKQIIYCEKCRIHGHMDDGEAVWS